jgi:hypothetical protein
LLLQRDMLIATLFNAEQANISSAVMSGLYSRAN